MRKGIVTMKRIVSLLAAAALIVPTAALAPTTANALEAATYYEYTQQRHEAFPDRSLRVGEVTVDGLIFDIYDDYAILTGCEDTSITTAVIPAYVNDLPVVGSVDTPFGYCRNLTKIELPDDFTHFSWDRLCCTFMTSSSRNTQEETDDPMPTVTEVYVSEDNPHFTLFDGLLYSKDMKTLIGCPPGLDMSDVYISPETETIGDSAFYACMGLKQANIPDTIKHINNGAFASCLNLESVTIPEDITTISGDTFLYCTSLNDVTFKGEVKTIGYGAFGYCTSLESFDIPESVTYIGSHAFENDPFLETVDGISYAGNWAVESETESPYLNFREGTVGISEMLFVVYRNCSNLYVPQSVKHVGDLFFGSMRSEIPTIIEYCPSYIGERTLAAAKTASDIYIYDRNCDIFDSPKTISATYKQSPKEDYIYIDGEQPEDIVGNTVIHGFYGSTAQAYAEKYDREFVPIERGQGDLNCDGRFGIADVVTFEKYLLGGSGVLDEYGFTSTADLNGDGKLNIFDLVEMREKITKE